MMDMLPVPAMEFKPVYDSAGAIVDLEFIWANAVATQALSQDGGALNGKTILETYPTAGEMLFYQSFVKTIEENRNLTFHVQAGLDSPIAGRHVKFATRPTEQGCFALMNDVTDVVVERNQARDQLKIMEAACNNAIHGIAVGDDTQTTIYANPALHKLLGYDAGELVGVHVNKMVAESDSRVRRETARNFLNDGLDQYVADRTYVTKDGEEVLMSVAVSTIIDASSGKKLALAHFRDVREERKAQSDLQDALEKAEEATRLKSEFLANMSHEIRTPLNGVIGMAQVLEHSNLSEKQAEYVAVIRDSSSNLMSLLNGILDLSKIEAGKVELDVVECDIRHKLNRIFKLHQSLAQQKGLDCNLIVHPSAVSYTHLTLPTIYSV